MFLKAGALSLALLLASRLLGLVRESAQAAAFGTSGLADVAVLMLSLPDWLAGVLASGALAYVLLPAWAGQGAAGVSASQRRVALALLAVGVVGALLLALGRETATGWLAPGLPPALHGPAGNALAWSALGLPAALLAALWVTRLQHERDFVGMYAANLVVNLTLIVAIVIAAFTAGVPSQLLVLGLGLLAAMLLRLGWLHGRTPRPASVLSASSEAALPAPSVWLWAILVAGLPPALPFVARSLASQGGQGALAVFNYAWKLVELPLVLAIQLVASLAFPAIARAFATPDVAQADTAGPVRSAFALAWALACAAAAALLVGAPAVAQLLFGWGRMDGQGLASVAQWGAAAAWGLLPQALIAVATTVLASQHRLRPAVLAYGLALAALLAAGSQGLDDGRQLMLLLNALLAGIALALLAALGPQLGSWLPWRTMALSGACLGLLAAATAMAGQPASVAGGLALALVAAALVLALTWVGSTELRAALRR